ncbi:16S rRNA (cytidine(1402)-2'-O)-methyltransferase [candidate division WOR-3 bacterium JGI_Cruoil_03_44_89]|uniref:Ribosomal RNA small subunit methyltransferase I n=1 Tax=candidate division WOR-3 bacterium JGI_Cruoil_03_44_89 TaxID=1973748 RepID=A0A235BNQ4_UNCW3|nr:MAG: 16S rRNA (cytidine(1402)-2'-O)-methyltransferase [candidate division WOR-3 bacterium JGI_Cruoil_03_44_89]OYD14451.1 MAG: 16S rRNA (cytidine(1402)-2'-O)-methyltransferase [candidate division WOR-3 bacterium JGI_Cruoil_03_44_89]
MQPALYLVSTPIGNLKDITLRAIEILKDVNIIASEDTRKTRILLSTYNIKKPLVSYYEHNKELRTPKIISRIKSGQSVALVTDSGTPGIQDPGFYLVREAIGNGIDVIPIPGPSAFVSALVSSGFPTDRFSFEGFLSRRRGRRRKRLQEITDYRGSLIFYESPHRLLAYLEDVLKVLGNRRIAVARELTKKFEEINRGTVEEMIKYFTENSPRGEFVIVVEGNTDGYRTIQE